MKNSKSSLILHDYFAIKGGGERLALTLAQGLGCPLHTAFWGPQSYAAQEWPKVAITTFARPPLIPALRMALLVGVWQHYSVTDCFSSALYSGSYAPLPVGSINARRHVLYCHTPPRFLYDQREYFTARLPFWQRPLLKWLCRYFQPRYESAVKGMDLVIANSVNVKRRIQRYLYRDATVVYPPCDVARFKWQGQGDYYLSTARLDSLKRVDLVVRAFC